MSRRRKNASAPKAPDAPAPATLAMSRAEVHVLAAFAALICVALGWLSRHALNPDGVSYLDLAALATRGDWRHFVQGYWSPLLPSLLAMISGVTGLAGSRLVAPAHWLNLAAALGCIVVLWRWSLERLPTIFGRAAIPALLLCSAGMPRIEAVTPDVPLLLVVTWLGYELIERGGRRWILIGLLLGAAFLVKTSCWPWILLSVPVRWWAATDGAARRRVVRSTIAAAAVMAVWIVPLSLAAGHPTLGSSGRLNYSWYIESSTSRLPDTDTGDHRDYHRIAIGGGREIVVATFDDAAAWTYQPWGDPTGWAAGSLTETGHPPTAPQLLSYWGRLAMRTFGIWLLPVIGAVMVPLLLLAHRTGMIRELATTQRDAAAAIALGLGGVMQFIAVHAEPRLIAPFGMLLALGVIAWCCVPSPQRAGRVPFKVRMAMSEAGLATALVFGAIKMAEGVQSDARLAPVVANLDMLRSRLLAADESSVPVGIVGYSAPVLGAAYWIGAHVTMQVPPASADLLATLPVAQQDSILHSVFSGRVPLVWRSSASGDMRMELVPPP
ncbi:MAG: hypothetical protein ACREL5_12665 [Gemmatimonadales bacterium]